jgi:2-polyprenyl-6-methoxyphenol hydroxylase-like FAD-dependent oxidoreductase
VGQATQRRDFILEAARDVCLRARRKPGSSFYGLIRHFAEAAQCGDNNGGKARNRHCRRWDCRRVNGNRIARTGIPTLLLEKSIQFVDRIRGEASWGVIEARQIGVLDLLDAAGAVYIRRNVPYGEGIPPEVAQANAIAVDEQVPGSQGNLDIGHPLMCRTLTSAAVSAGANLLRGVSEVRVSHGMPPIIKFVHEGRRHEIKPRLIIGADGRSSAVAKQIGAIVQSDPVHHLMGGLLVERFPDWPIEDMAIGTEGDVTFYVFPAKEHMRL